MYNAMGGSMTELAKQQILRQQMHAMFPYFIKVEHPDYGTFYYVNADNDMTYDNQTYTACCFSIKPPDKSENKIGDAKLEFSTIYNNREWVKKIRNTVKRGTITVMASIVYTAENTVDGIEPIYDTEFTLTDVSWNETDLSWTMKFDEGMDIIMPCDKMDEIICAGVV